MSDRYEPLSRRLSYLLRHRPDAVGIELGPDGWVDLDELVAAMTRHGDDVTSETVERVAVTSPKQRFEIESGRIRAAQGHSVPVDLALEPIEPPHLLYHGTVERYLRSIRREGLLPGDRTHVHLSPDVESAWAVGARRGQPVVLVVNSEKMARADHPFFRSANGVWLTESVPARFIDFEAG